MLKELNGIAADLLGLGGYPLQPLPWAEIFGVRPRAKAATTPSEARGSSPRTCHPARASHAPAIDPACS